MGELRRWSGWALAAVAAVVIVIGLLPANASPDDPAARADALAANLRCPFCQGESIADAPSQTARDLQVFIVDKVDEGWSDDEIYAFFVARYGERVRLDPPLAGWGAALWAVPAVLLAVGVAAIAARRRPEPQTDVTAGSMPDPGNEPETAPETDAGPRSVPPGDEPSTPDPGRDEEVAR